LVFLAPPAIFLLARLALRRFLGAPRLLLLAAAFILLAPFAVFLRALAVLFELGLHLRLEPLAQLVGIALRLLLHFPARDLGGLGRASLGIFARAALFLELAGEFGFQFCLRLRFRFRFRLGL